MSVFPRSPRGMNFATATIPRAGSRPSGTQATRGWQPCRTPTSDQRCSSPRTTEKQDVAVGILELESAQTVAGVSQRLGELDIARGKFGRQRVWIWDRDERIPTSGPLAHVSCVIWHRS